MGSKVPHDVYVMLEEAQIYPSRIKIVEIAQGTIVDQLPDLPHRATEQKRVVDHDFESLPIGQLDQLLGLLRRRGERFFDKDVFAMLQSGFGQLVMRPDRSNHCDGVDLRRSQELREVHRQLDTGINSSCAPERVRILVADGDKLTVFETLKIPDDIRTPITVADNTNTNEIRRALVRVGLQPLGDLRHSRLGETIANGICLGSHFEHSPKN